MFDSVDLKPEKNCNALDVGTDIGVGYPAAGIGAGSNFYIF